MAGNEETINQEGISDSSPEVDGGIEPGQSSEVRTIQTVDDVVPDASAETIKTDEEQETTEEKGEAEKGAEGDDTRFDKHPRFQELIKERNEAREARIRAETERDFLKERVPLARPEDKEEVKGDFENILEMDDDTIRDQLDSNPKALMANILRQAKAELSEELTGQFEQKETDRTIMSTFDTYAKDNADFDPMWKSGEIQGFMRANPGHNAISAHMMLTGEKRTQAEIDAAVKKAVEKERQNVRQKKETTVLSDGPSAVPTEAGAVDTQLKDTKAHGGFINVATQRLQQMRRGK